LWDVGRHDRADRHTPDGGDQPVSFSERTRSGEDVDVPLGEGGQRVGKSDLANTQLHIWAPAVKLGK
jgi:hypothetical protein